MSNKTSITWEAPEYKHYEKTIGWYISLISITILITGFFIIIQKDYFAGITILFLCIIIIFFSKQKPENISISLTTKGIHQGDLHIPYKHIKHFWIVYTPNHQTINFETSSYLNKFVILELESQEPEDVREFLLNFLPEHEAIAPTISQRVTHWFKF